MEIVQEAERTTNLRGKLAKLEADRDVAAKKARKAKLAPLRISAHRFADEVSELLGTGQIGPDEAEARVMAFVAVNDSAYDLELFEMDHLEKLVCERSGIVIQHHH